MALSVKSIIFKEFVEEGEVTPDKFVEQESQPLDPAQLADGSVLLQTLYLSVDPYMRGRMRNVKGYLSGPLQPGEPVTGIGAARVIASKTDKFSAGDIVTGFVPWSTYFVIGPEQLNYLTKIQNKQKLPLSYYIGACGMPGFTAYASLIKIAQPKAGETAFVSGAAGAVGMVVGQLLKNVYGCRVVGSAGTDEKVEFLTSKLGFDAAFNYKKVSATEGLKTHCPDGIDIYFDNVGGETLEAVLDAANKFARVVCCGMISQYDSKREDKYGVRTLDNLVWKSIHMQGFLVMQYAAELQAKFNEEMPELVASGKVNAVEHVVSGLENAGKAFCDMMAGVNLGKMVVAVAPEADPSKAT